MFVELQCVKCDQPTGVHCHNADCLWTVCVPCGLIYAPTGCIPTWERYSKGLKR